MTGAAAGTATTEISTRTMSGSDPGGAADRDRSSVPLTATLSPAWSVRSTAGGTRSWSAPRTTPVFE
jgi:hypothetical protein